MVRRLIVEEQAIKEAIGAAVKAAGEAPEGCRRRKEEEKEKEGNKTAEAEAEDN